MTTIKEVLDKLNINLELPEAWQKKELDEEYEYKYHKESVNYDRIINEEKQDYHRNIKPYKIHVLSHEGAGRGPVQDKEEDEIIIDLNNMLLTFIGADSTVMQFDENGELILDWV